MSNYSDYSNYSNYSDIYEKKENITQRNISNSSQTKIIYKCSTDDNINNNCNFQNIENTSEIYNIIKENIISLYSQNNGKSQIIKGENNITFQITNSKNELESLKGGVSNNQNLSILDLGECKTTLREIYHINESDSFIILKKEYIFPKSSKKKVEYEIFDPYTFKPLNLSLCKDNKINLYVKADLSEETQKIYENMKSMGYNMFDINDPFYQDFCTPFKTENNTDIVLSDRIDYIYNNKDSQCQSNCHFSSYLPNSFYLNCTCDAVNDNNDDNLKAEDKFSGKKLYESFYDVLKYSNFKIIKCYNLILNKNVLSKNIGSIIIIIIFSIYLLCLIIFIIKGIAPLMEKLIPKRKNNINNNINFNNIIIHNKQIENKKSNTRLAKNKIKLNPVKRKIILPNFNIKEERGKLNQIYRLNRKKIKSKSIKNSKFYNSIIKNNIPSSKEKISFSSRKNSVIQFGAINTKKPKTQKKLDSFQLNNLEYDEAIIYDKRTFIRTYCDLLCREHKIIFTFFICNDYNILYIKYARFIFLFSTDMAMNVFFFSDESMHKIFLNYGKYNFIQQIPQIVYTTIISQLMEIFLCYLSLTDKHIYNIKDLNQAFEREKIRSILKCIKIKLVSFFIFTFIIFILYWYIVSTFCAVYENTQIIFLKDCFLSFGLGLIYPIIIYLIPSCLRIISIRNSKQGLKCLYKLSDIIPFF